MTDPPTSVLSNFLALNNKGKKKSQNEPIPYPVVGIQMTVLGLNSEVLERFPFSSLP